MFDLQGHRGARGLFPENTLDGLRRRVRLGLRSFEIDIAMTRDGVPVVHHDPHLNPDITRGPDGAWLAGRAARCCATLTLAELAGYDVGRIKPGTAYAATYADPGAGTTAHASRRWRQVLRARSGAALQHRAEAHSPTTRTGPCRAEEMAERVLDVVDRAGAAGRVTIQSFDWRAPRHVRRIRPDVPTGWLTRGGDDAGGAALAREADASSSMTRVPDAIAAAGGGTWTPSTPS